MNQSHFYGGQRPALVKPIDVCQRGMYETGRPPTGDGPNFNTPALPTTPWENIAQIASQPVWLMFLHCTFLQTWNVSAYTILFDLNPSDPNQLNLVGNGAIGRFTFGPVVAASGGTVIYESSAERVAIPPSRNQANPNAPEREWAYGIPFNFGIIAAASSTPRVLTLPDAGLQMSIVARVQT